MAETTSAPVAIIGAGLGGLATALRLASRGIPVEVFERAATPGGKMRTLPTPAGPVDAGPTVLTMRWVFDALFAQAGTRLQDHLTLTQDPLIARHYWPDGACLDLHADPSASRHAVKAFAGAKGLADYDRFCARTQALLSAFDAPVIRSPRPDVAGILRATFGPGRAALPYLMPWATLARALDGTFSDPRLAQLFGRYATYVGGDPKLSPAVLSLIWQSEAAGVWSIKGGLYRLAEVLADLAAEAGARFHYNTHVAAITTQGRTATGVQLQDGTRLPASQVVFNGDPQALAQGFLGPDVCGAVRASGHKDRSLSAYVWSFAAKPSGVPLGHHTVFFGQDQRSEFDPIARGQMAQDPTLYICAQDHGHPSSDGLERFEIILNASPSGSTSAQPDEARLCQTCTFQTLAKRGLTFAPEPQTDALTTPSKFATLFPGSDGSLYGRSPHGMMASFLRPTAQSRIKGLVLAGGGVHPGAGIPMATLSGQHAAETILRARTSTSRSPKTAMPGGMSTASQTMAPAPSRSSAS
ncbi:MAG: 1-hydroxycarotenoid 3,4-desaturase CrtD [Pseudomonadota bacterium]